MSKKKASIASVVAKISQAEWEVMQILWEDGNPLPATEIATLRRKAF